jgi:hypothetical protein
MRIVPFVYSRGEKTGEYPKELLSLTARKRKRFTVWSSIGIIGWGTDTEVPLICFFFSFFCYFFHPGNSIA